MYIYVFCEYFLAWGQKVKRLEQGANEAKVGFNLCMSQLILFRQTTIPQMQFELLNPDSHAKPCQWTQENIKRKGVLAQDK